MKTPEYTKRAVNNYRARKQESGLLEKKFWVSEETNTKLQKVADKLNIAKQDVLNHLDFEKMLSS